MKRSYTVEIISFKKIELVCLFSFCTKKLQTFLYENIIFLITSKNFYLTLVEFYSIYLHNISRYNLNCKLNSYFNYKEIIFSCCTA